MKNETNQHYNKFTIYIYIYITVGNCSKCCWKVLNTHECRAKYSSKWLKLKLNLSDECVSTKLRVTGNHACFILVILNCIYIYIYVFFFFGAYEFFSCGSLVTQANFVQTWINYVRESWWLEDILWRLGHFKLTNFSSYLLQRSKFGSKTY